MPTNTPTRRPDPTISPIRRELTEVPVRVVDDVVPRSSRYQGRIALLFGAELSGGSRVFRQKSVVFPLLLLLRESLAAHGCTTYAFCFIGGELRVLITGVTDQAEPRQAFLAFQDASRKWLIEYGHPVWAPRVFCRPVLDIAECQNAAFDVLAGPAASGLPPRLCQYPFVGAIEATVPG